MMKRLSTSVFFMVWVFVWFLALAVPPALAEDSEVGTLRLELNALKRAVERLDERLTELEHRLSGRAAGSGSMEPGEAKKVGPSAPATAAPPVSSLSQPGGPAGKEASGRTVKAAVVPPPAPSQPEGLSKTQEQAIRDRWKNLRRGMTPQEVESALGKPEQTMEVDRQTVWYYRYSGVGASVVFNREGHVSGWQKPPFGLLW